MRTAKEIDKDELKKVVEELESHQTYPAQTQLAQAVLETEWGKQQGVSPATILNRINSFGIILKTQKGKRGRASLNGQKIKRKNKNNSSAKQALLKATPEKYHKLVDRAIAGSKVAQLRLVCLNCVCWQPKEIALCNITGCPVHFSRPYQKGSNEDITEIQD